MFFGTMAVGILFIELPLSPEAMKPFSEPEQEQLKDQLELTTACLVCGKPLKKQAKGSLTGWIFDNDYRAITDRWMCSCAPGGATVKLQLSTDDPNATVPDNASISHELSGMPAAPATESEGVTTLRKTLLNTTIDGQWQVTSVLESGHMGTVYLGQDLKNQRTVAIKVLRSELSGNSRIVKRFLQECEKAAAIAHHNICAVFGSGKLPDGSGYVVMDYIEGENLEAKIRKEGFLDIGEALALFIDLTLGLEHAHNQGVIHRGLKPTNILFDKADDNVKIADFGVAKAIPSIGKETIQLSAIADIFGDPMCMSPEQCLGEDVDARSDIYSLACVMYYALTGKPPFLFQNGCQTAMAQVSQLPPAFKETMFNCDIPASVEAVVMRALEKDPEDRYQTMAQLRADLEILKRGGTPAIPKPKRAGKRRVLQLPRADVVTTNPKDLIPPTGTALKNPSGAIAKVNTQVATKSPDPTRRLMVGAVCLVLAALTAYVVYMAIFLSLPHVISPMYQQPPISVVPSGNMDVSPNMTRVRQDREDVMKALSKSAADMRDLQLTLAKDKVSAIQDKESAILDSGLRHLEMGQATDANVCFSRVIAMDPINDIALGGKARAYLLQGLFHDAVAEATSAIIIKPTAGYFDTRAEAYTQLEMYDKALSDCTAAINIDASDANAYTNRADIYTSQKKYALALKDYDKLLSMDKTDAETYAGRGWMYAESGQYDKAVHDANTALRLDPESDAALNTRGYAVFCQAKGDSAVDKALLAKAVSDFSRAIALKPDNGEYYFHRSQAYSQLGEKEKAVFDANKATELGYE